jgi:hypothetical protein
VPACRRTCLAGGDETVSSPEAANFLLRLFPQRLLQQERRPGFTLLGGAVDLPDIRLTGYLYTLCDAIFTPQYVKLFNSLNKLLFAGIFLWSSAQIAGLGCRLWSV